MTTTNPTLNPTTHSTIVSLTITKWGRFWAVHDADGHLVCLTVYRKGAREVVYRLSEILRVNSLPAEDTRTSEWKTTDRDDQ